MICAALTRGDLADYVNALFIVYIILIFGNILISYVASHALQPRRCGSCSTSSQRRPTPT